MQCKHTHLAKNADKWTIFGAAGEAVASFISDAYWLGGLIDLMAQLDEGGVGLSWYGLGIGCALSLGLTIGSVYAHSVVNINHQEGHAHEHHRGHAHGQSHKHDSLLAEQGENHAHSIGNINHQEEHPHEHHKGHAHGQSLKEHDSLLAERGDDQHAHLTMMQKAALVGDFISHVGDIAGPITFVAEIAAKDRMPAWGTALVQCSATLFGAAASVAGVRTCKNNMLLLNRQNEHCEHNSSEESHANYEPTN